MPRAFCVLVFLKRLELRTVDLDVLLDGASPSYSILDYLLNVLVSESEIGLVTGLEVENLTVCASPGASASEYFAALVPAKPLSSFRTGP